MKKKMIIALLAGGMLFVPFGLQQAYCLAADSSGQICEEQSNQPKSLTIDVAGVNKYGSVALSCTSAELLQAGYEYGDLLQVDTQYYGSKLVVFTPEFSSAGIGMLSISDDAGRESKLSLFMLSVSTDCLFAGQLPEKVTVSLAKRHFLSLMPLSRTNLRDDYQSDEEFANFREVVGKQIKPKTLYRGSNPLNEKANPGRCGYVDKLARQAEIKTIIDMADSDEKLQKIKQLPDYSGKLYADGQVAALAILPDMFLQESKEKLAKGIRFMLKKDGPYLFNCNEGKDRTGLFAIVLEALAGCSVEEIKQDYLLTYCNYYHIRQGSAEYERFSRISIDRLLRILAEPEIKMQIGKFDWQDKTVPSAAEIQKAAYDYLLSAGLSVEEIELLKSRYCK